MIVRRVDNHSSLRPPATRPVRSRREGTAARFTRALSRATRSVLSGDALSRWRGVVVRLRVGPVELGMTLVELTLVVAIIATIAMIVVPNYLAIRERSVMAATIVNIRAIEDAIGAYWHDNRVYPTSLDGITPYMKLVPRDPWGRPYQYLNIRNAPKPPRNEWRRDRFLVPINSDFDLYSMGPDGRSQQNINGSWSRDDIIRAADGAFVGIATEY
jgi:general secretion pathway protein G